MQHSSWRVFSLPSRSVNDSQAIAATALLATSFPGFHSSLTLLHLERPFPHSSPSFHKICTTRSQPRTRLALYHIQRLRPDTLTCPLARSLFTIPAITLERFRHELERHLRVRPALRFSLSITASDINRRQFRVNHVAFSQPRPISSTS